MIEVSADGPLTLAREEMSRATEGCCPFHGYHAEAFDGPWAICPASRMRFRAETLDNVVVVYTLLAGRVRRYTEEV